MAHVQTFIGLELGASQVVASNLGAKSVTQPKLAVEAVAFENIEHAAAAPAKGAEKAVTAGLRNPIRKRAFSYVSDGVETTIKLKHELATTLLIVSGQKQKAAEAIGGECLVNSKEAAATAFMWKAASTEEIEVTFGAKPAAGEEFFFTVAG